MTVSRTAAVAGIGLLLLGSAIPARASLDRQVILVLERQGAYREAATDLDGLTIHGGIGLMTAAGAEGAGAAALTIGSGRAASRPPSGPIRFDQEGAEVAVDVRGLASAADPAVPGLLGTTLAEAGMQVGYLDPRGAGPDPAMLAAIDTAGRIPLASLNEFPVLGETFPPSVAGDRDAPVADAELVVTPTRSVLAFLLERSEADEVMVVVATLTPPPASSDVVTPAVVATAPPARLLETIDQPGMLTWSRGGLTSDTTRREGLVSNVDMAPTIAGFLGVEPPEEMVGAPIRVSGDPPTALYERVQQWRRVVTPVGIGVLAFAIIAMIAGLVAVFTRRPSSPLGARAIALFGLASVAFLVLLVPLALLPSFDVRLVAAALLVGAAALVLVAVRLDDGRGRTAVAFLGATGAGVVVLDGVLGWPSGLTPFLGGSALDGERFFGLGNPYAGILLGGIVLVASRLRPAAGVAVVVAAALFAGLPFLGADLGGGLTLFLAAGLLYGLHRWDGLGWRTWLVAGAAGAAGLALLVLSHEALPPGTTHVSRAVGSASGPLGIVEVWWRRLMLNVEITTAAWPIWIVVLALPVWLAVLLRPPGSIRPMLDADASWRRAAIVLAVAGILGYVLNDTYGTATITFVLLSAAVLYPALRSSAGAEDPAGAAAR